MNEAKIETPVDRNSARAQAIAALTDTRTRWAALISSKPEVFGDSFDGDITNLDDAIATLQTQDATVDPHVVMSLRDMLAEKNQLISTLGAKIARLESGKVIVVDKQGVIGGQG